MNKGLGVPLVFRHVAETLGSCHSLQRANALSIPVSATVTHAGAVPLNTDRNIINLSTDK